MTGALAGVVAGFVAGAMARMRTEDLTTPLLFGRMA